MEGYTIFYYCRYDYILPTMIRTAKIGFSEFIRLMTFAKVMKQEFKSREFLSISKSVFKIQKMAVRKTF